MNNAYISACYSDLNDFRYLETGDFLAVVFTKADLKEAFEVPDLQSDKVLDTLALEVQDVIDAYLRTRVPAILADLPPPYESVDFEDHTTGVEIVKVPELLDGARKYINLIFGIKQVESEAMQICVFSGKRLERKSKIDVAGLGQDEIDSIIAAAYAQDFFNRSCEG